MVSVALIGLGRIGISHLENLLSIRNINVLTVCDMQLEVAKNVAETYKIPHYTNNTDDIFADAQIDAVVIVSSTPTHFEFVTKALRANKAVFVEKPLTLDLQQSLEIEKVVAETNGYCQVGFMRRFDRDYVEARKIIESGSIGQPIYFKSISRDPFPPPIAFIEKSGGIFIDMMIHDLDIAHFLMNDTISQVAAFGGVIKYPEFKQANDVDQAMVHLRFAKGAMGDVEASRIAYYGYDVRTEVVGTEGSILIGSNKKNNIQILTNKGNTHTLNPIFTDRFEGAFVAELRAFADAVQNHLPSVSTVSDSIRALKVAHAATASLKQNGILVDSDI